LYSFLLAFLNDPDNGVAGLALRLLADHVEDLLEPVDLTFCLGPVLFESCAEIVGLSRLGHLGQGR
jgi:hypothetical protein